MSKKDKKQKKGTRIYRIIDRVSLFSKIARKGGIKVKWAIVIFFIILLIVFMFSIISTLLSANALISANDNLCQTIASNISSAESILTAEKKPYKRSLILQDIISGLAKSDISGLEYATVYDLDGQLSERKRAYAAHTKSYMRTKWIPRKVYSEIRDVENFEKKRVILKNKKKGEYACYQYRMPFKFFDVPVGIIEIIFTEESIIAPIWNAVLYILIMGGVLLIFGVVISTKVATGMVRPVRKLTNGMHKVRGGDLGVEMEIYRHDELGDLSDEFNDMISHLREKLHMQKFVSESTISMIKEKTQSGKHVDNLGLGGSRENLVFLFSDVRGFTAMSEKMEPEEVVTILNEYLDIQAQIIKKNKGDIDKFVGDEIMAVFSGKKREDNAIKSAVEIIDKINILNDEKNDMGLRTIDVGIGLNVGDVVHGRMGSRDRMDNTSIGDAVNLAARLCSQANPGEILASEEIMTKATKGKFKGKKLDPIKVKGKVKPIKIFAVTGVKK